MIPEVRPERFGREGDELARFLLERAALRCGGARFRIEEVELYLHAEGHPDPFVHCHPRQRTSGRWYFHRRGAGYRGGSFKGLDLTFGPPDTFGGALIRTLRRDDGRRFCGPSLSVDALLAAAGVAHPRELDDGRAVEDLAGSLVLGASRSRRAEVWRTARVGLSLRRWDGREPLRPAYVMRTYRFVSDAALPKGRVQTVLGLARAGLDLAAIVAATGCRPRTVERWLAAFERGRREGELTRGERGGWSSEELAWIHGAWLARYGGLDTGAGAAGMLSET